MTRQRAVILEILRSDKEHHTAEEIFELAKKRLPTISRATVYNNLHALESECIIRRISAEDGADRYDNSFVPHGHLFCTRCKRVFDFTIPDFDKTLCDIIGCNAESYELKIRGVCSDCREFNSGE